MATRRPVLRFHQSRLNQEGDMRAIDCPCGHHFEAPDDEQLFRLCRDHVDADHPELHRSDEQLRARLAADAYDVVPVA